MNENSNHETYLFISKKKYIISVNKEFNQKIYLEEFGLNDASIKKPLDHLEFFLNDNIFKIEKKLNDFVKKISVILDLDIFFPIEISIKKDINNEEKPVTAITAKDITNATFNEEVTAKAEQIPNTCKVIGLLSTSGSTSNCFLV